MNPDFTFNYARGFLKKIEFAGLNFTFFTACLITPDLRGVLKFRKHSANFFGCLVSEQ